MNKVLEWFEKKQKETFYKYEACLFGLMEISKTKDKDLLQTVCGGALFTYCFYYDIKRGLITFVRKKINEKEAQKKLAEFYETHTPPYSDDDKCLLIALQMATDKGRGMLAKSMLDPIREKINAKI